MTSQSKRLGVTKTSLPPCCLRIHPIDTSLIILGTYQLDKPTGKRTGSIDLYRFDQDGLNLTLIKSIATESAVLDIKISPFDPSLLVSAHSTGNIQLWTVEHVSPDITLVENRHIFDSEILITSIFFNPQEKNKVVATLTSGELALIDLNDFSHDVFDTVHDLECWTAGFGELGQLSNVVFTGGDDAKLIAHDLRMKNSFWSTSYKHHDAGVVSILSPNKNWNNSNSNHLWTGSYDDNLRILDSRVMDKENPELIPGFIPKVLEQKNLGGGVWRLIPSPIENDDRVMSCCMYDGARIIDQVDQLFQVSRYFKKDHESMCYGGDWSQDGKYIATCSFYDNVVQIWSPNDVE